MVAALYMPRRLTDLLPAQQAGILCGEVRFWRFLVDRRGELVIDTDQAARAVRTLCGVDSRSELIPGSRAAAAWAAILTEYQRWSRTR